MHPFLVRHIASRATGKEVYHKPIPVGSTWPDYAFLAIPGGYW